MKFFKLQASGNDFILIENQRSAVKTQKLKALAGRLCPRKFGVGADGILVVEPSKKTLFRMRIFNPDGSEAEMCGNGARCAALWASRRLRKGVENIRFDTKAGIIEARVSYRKAKGEVSYYADVKVKISRVSNMRLDLPITIFGRRVKINYINTGVPHSIILVEGLDKINVEEIGRKIRFHRVFKPAGTNVDFAEILKDKFIAIRTYERGVESETFACGTGVVASAVIAAQKVMTLQNYKYKFNVLTRSGEILQVYFTKDESKITDVWLEGKAYFVYEGEINTNYLL